MIRTILFLITLGILIPASTTWGLTLVSHPAVKVEEGLVFEPICPQKRSTPTAPDEYLNRVNPLEPTDSNIFAGQTLFHFDASPGPCRACHGMSGNGLSILLRELTPSPRNFTCGQVMDTLPDGQLFWIIQNGSPGTTMPAFKQLEDEQIWQLIHYIRHFSEKYSSEPSH